MTTMNSAMERQLSDIDKVYVKLQNYASREEMIKYCKSVIERTEIFMRAHGDNVTDHIKQNLSEITFAARQEIKNLLSRKK